MGVSCIDTKQLQVNFSPKSDYSAILINLMRQAEIHLKNGKIPETIEALSHAFNLVPVFSTAYKAIRHLLLILQSPSPAPSRPYFNNNALNLRCFLGFCLVLAGVVKVILTQAALALLAGVVGEIMNALAWSLGLRSGIRQKNGEKAACTTPSSRTKSVND